MDREAYEILIAKEKRPATKQRQTKLKQELNYESDKTKLECLVRKKWYKENVWENIKRQ